MDETSLQSGLEELDNLSREEYQASLEDVLKEADDELVARRLGRLIGVLVKEPFAEPRPLGERSPRSGAYRAWELIGETEFNAQIGSDVWQSRVLSELKHQEGLEMTDYQYALNLQYEWGFFGAFARTVGKYICGDEEIRKNVEEALARAKLPNLSPEHVVGSGGLALGGYLIAVIPLLGFVGAPALAALLLILYRLGVEAFCGISENADAGVEQG